jgi:hypothetical protein
MNQIRIRDNATIRPINISGDKLKRINKIINSKIYCCVCGEVAESEVIYVLEGVTRTERYCNSCISKVYKRD